VRDNKHRHAFFRKLLHDVQNVADKLRVKGAGGLIEQHHFRFHGERTGDGHTLLLAAGKLCGVGIELIAEADLI